MFKLNQFKLSKKVLLPLVLSAMAMPALAIDKTIVATIDGKNIIAEELILTAKQNKIDYATLNNSQKALLLNGLINRVIVAKEAKKMMLDKVPDVKVRLNALTDSVLAATMLENQTKKIKIADSVIQKFYNDKVAKSKQKQYKARHILVKDKTLASNLATKARSGSDFATLAKKHSTDKGSAVKGGDLGWFNPSTMVPTFAAAVKSATKGKVTDPVKSQFGWHVIIVDDAKDITPPSYKDSKEKIKQLMMKQQISAYLEGLKKKHKIVNKLVK